MGAIGKNVGTWLGTRLPAFLAKHFLKPSRDQIKVGFRGEPAIYINEPANHCSFDFRVEISNRNPYPITVQAFECDVHNDGSGIVKLEKGMPITIGGHRDATISIEKNLTEYQVRRIIEHYRDSTDRQGTFEFTFALRTIHGEETVRVRCGSVILLRRTEAQ